MHTGNQFGGQPQESFPTRRQGQISRGQGTPSDLSDYVGGVYVDASDNKLYIKRKPTGTAGNWGDYVFILATATANSIKWYGEDRPDQDMGVDGDYFLLWRCDSASIEPALFGPKANGVWPENGEGLEVCAQDFTTFLPVGVLDETTALPFDPTEEFRFFGVLDEAQSTEAFIPVCVLPLGLITWGDVLGATLNECWNIDPSIQAGQYAKLGIGLDSEGAI